MNIQRMADRRRQTIDRLLEAGKLRGEAVSLPPSAWTVDEIAGPNITDKETVLAFAKMASNAYIVIPHTGEWEDVRSKHKSLLSPVLTPNRLVEVSTTPKTLAGKTMVFAATSSQTQRTRRLSLV